LICREFIALLDVYRTREGPAEQLRLCEQHLAGCASCRAYLDSYEKTIALGRAACLDLDGPVPEDVPEDLIQALLTLRPPG
jgi:hypothetical protein